MKMLRLSMMLHRLEAKPVLRHFSFNFAANRSYAIVGESGVGKTTIVSLLLRLYDPPSRADFN